MAILLKNGSIAAENGVREADLLLQDEKIVQIGAGLKPGLDTEVIDCAGKYILPGIIDAHVHFHMPCGPSERTIDDFYSGSVAAACGGVTTVIDYVEPENDQGPLEAVAARKKEADGAICIDYGLHYVVNRWEEKLFESWEQVIDSGLASFKVFTTYDSSRLPYEDVAKLLAWSKKRGVLVTVHAEEDDIIQAAKKELTREGHLQPAYHGKSRPVESEAAAVKKIIALAGETGSRVYFVHISTCEAAQLIGQAQKEGKQILGETCPHYLVLGDEVYAGADPQWYIMCPPLREKEKQPFLWSALKEGVFSVVASDHCAFSKEQKGRSRTFFETLSGIPGVETLLPVMYAYGVAPGQITMTRLVELLSTNPARLFGLYPQKGVIRTGSDGDIVVFDPQKEVELSYHRLHSKAGYSPFKDMHVKGCPEITVLRGKVIYRGEQFCGAKGYGKFVPGRI
ncbi:dihydropyrimidinase [Candidatus Formimonas warabiya]|uniref:Dihydropyrimidinase n=1 Tax=Formimonas warabiya TaxID=1761012 RepID=A0A3G1KTN9_FORW1|nr:dihydropyrimidinase [Candidatus Formimonas warabiya]ATW25832.1 dihydropyrimidinase [Candidatus Formimonas warabiya]